MEAMQTMLLHMVPVIENASDTSTVGDIGTVPAVRVELGIGDNNFATIGLIDTGAELSVLDDRIVDQISAEIHPVMFKHAISGKGPQSEPLPLYSFNVRICAESSDEALVFSNVPVVVTRLNLPYFLIGRRGLLELVKMELDFPQRVVILSTARCSRDLYPALSQVFPSLGSALEAFEAGENARGIMLLAWDMERFVDRLVAEDAHLKGLLSTSELRRATLGSKLTRVCSEFGMTELSEAIAGFAEARNQAAHGSRGVMATDTQGVVSAAESIVARLLARKEETP